MRNSVSVIIPTHNRAHCLPRAIDSVLDQTQPANEVIVIDDGSTDDTEMLVTNKYPTVHYIKQSQQGVSASRNCGIKKSSSQWIALLDSDDSWNTNKLEKQWIALQKNPTLLCHTDEIWIRNGKRVNPMKKHRKSSNDLFNRSLELCLISPSSALIHRSLFESVGYFDQALPACEDYDLWLRITANHQTTFVEEALITKYGGHADQLSQKHWGMDRFRVQALLNILQSGFLSLSQYQAAQAMLVAKSAILKAGAEKRSNDERVEYYQQLIERHS